MGNLTFAPRITMATVAWDSLCLIQRATPLFPPVGTASLAAGMTMRPNGWLATSMAMEKQTCPHCLTGETTQLCSTCFLQTGAHSRVTPVGITLVPVDLIGMRL